MTPEVEVAVNLIVDRACQYMGVRREWLEGKSQKAYVCEPRNVIMYILHKDFGLFLKDTGSIFNRDHCTVIASCKEFEARRNDNPFYSESYTGIHGFLVAENIDLWNACEVIKTDAKVRKVYQEIGAKTVQLKTNNSLTDFDKEKIKKSIDFLLTRIPIHPHNLNIPNDFNS